MSERSERALVKTNKYMRATTKLTLFHSIAFSSCSLTPSCPSLIGQTTPKNKGKISRVLAAKSSLAIRVDALGDGSEDTTIGQESRAKVESRIRALDGGVVPMNSGSTGLTSTKVAKHVVSKNGGGGYNDASDVVGVVGAGGDEENEKEEKKRKKEEKKKRKREEEEEEEEGGGGEAVIVTEETKTPKKEKKEKKEKKDKSEKKAKKAKK